MPAIALKGHKHTCPAYVEPKAHKGGPIIEGNDIVKINGKSVALVGDKCECQVGGPDTIITGSSLFTINGIPVAMKGSKTEHGGIIIEGDETLIIQ